MIRNSIDFLGCKFVKPNWTECYFSVEDIGFLTVWGLIRERKTDIVRSTEFYSLLEDWEPYDENEAMSFINRIPVLEK